MNILYIQYAGDFAKTYEHLYVRGGKENYYGQQYSVGAVVEQARRGLRVLVLAKKTTGYPQIELEENLEAIGLTNDKNSYKEIIGVIDNFCPDRVILRFPDAKILKYLRKNNVPTFPVFADSFESAGGLKARIRRLMLSYELKNKCVRWIGNHQLNAARSICNLGVSPSKVLPYDWEHGVVPEDWSKEIPLDIHEKEIVVFYAGQISYEKGVFDLIESAKYVKGLGRTIVIRLAGKGYCNTIEKFAEQLGVGGCLEFLGLIDHDDVLKNMNSADVVVVPSHHSYPEGLPMTIMESLMVHTPVIASDHPMFVGRVGKRGAVQFFPEKNAGALAKRIISVLSNYEEYQKNSYDAVREWHDLCLELKWADMINLWIDNPLECDLSESTIDKFNF